MREAEPAAAEEPACAGNAATAEELAGAGEPAGAVRGEAVRSGRRENPSQGVKRRIRLYLFERNSKRYSPYSGCQAVWLQSAPMRPPFTKRLSVCLSIGVVLNENIFCP